MLHSCTHMATVGVKGLNQTTTEHGTCGLANVRRKMVPCSTHR